MVEILMTMSQPMKILSLANEPLRKFCSVVCAIVATLPSKPQKFVG